MLLEISIENLALFERATVVFGPGLNVVSGETGAGKSLIVGALELLLGQRPRASMVRKGCDEALVEGRFVLGAELARAPEVRAFFEASLPDAIAEHDPEDELELVLTRRVSRAGRSRAYVDHRPVALRVLRELASHLVEIHGQNDHQRLFEPGEQLSLLDAFGGFEATLTAYRDARARWRELVDERLEWQRASADRHDRLDLLRFQAAELAELAPEEGETEELARERQVLRHANELGAELGGAAASIAGEQGSALELLQQARATLERWEGKVDALTPAAEELRDAALHLEEAAATLATFLGGLEVDPQRLEAVEERLYRLEELERRYRTDAAGLVARRREIESELARFEDGGAGDAELAGRCDAAREEVQAAAVQLTRARRGLRARLKKEVLASLADLGLERAAFDVAVEPREAEPVRSPNAEPEKARVAAELERFGPDGADRVEFLLGANPGEDVAPLRAVASGGEAARILLALRTALAVRRTIPTLVFDEVDAGVGGRLGPKVGAHLKRLGDCHQVLCVTHLPAIAAVADHHFKVEKHAERGRTRTRVIELEGDARVDEVADMIAGGARHATARAEAERLLTQPVTRPVTRRGTKADRG